ncbi:MAG: PilZ domain-containing protein [Nitrospirae bacterium]|nr:PilZ domain-containing protein [Nitrospirota bacterium]
MEHSPLHDIDPAAATAPQARRRPSRLPFLRFITYGHSASSGFDGNGHKSHAAAINVSEGGLCLLVHGPLQETDIIRVDLPLADVSTTSATLAEVKWLKPVPWSDPNEPQYFVGVQFLL